MNIDEFLNHLYETTTADVVPVLMAPTQMLRQKKGLVEPEDEEDNEDKSKKPKKRIVDSIIDDLDLETDIIPDDAEVDTSVDKINLTQTTSAEAPEKKVDDKLIDPAVALIAPDVTPKAEEPIDPSKLPSPGTENPTSALSTLLGKNPAPAVPTPATPTAASQEALFRSFGIQMPNAVESVPQVIQDLEKAKGVAETVVAASQPGIPMPVHQEGDVHKLCSAFRSVMG